MGLVRQQRRHRRQLARVSPTPFSNTTVGAEIGAGAGHMHDLTLHQQQVFAHLGLGRRRDQQQAAEQQGG